MGLWSSLFGQEKKWNQAMDGKVKYAERKPKRESKKFYTAEDRANLRESRAEEKAQKAQDRDNVKIRNRFNEYNTKTAILKEYYAAKGNYFGVNGVGSIQEITERLAKVFDTL